MWCAPSFARISNKWIQASSWLGRKVIRPLLTRGSHCPTTQTCDKKPKAAQIWIQSELDAASTGAALTTELVKQLDIIFQGKIQVKQCYIMELTRSSGSLLCCCKTSYNFNINIGQLKYLQADDHNPSRPSNMEATQSIMCTCSPGAELGLCIPVHLGETIQAAQLLLLSLKAMRHFLPDQVDTAPPAWSFKPHLI